MLEVANFLSPLPTRALFAEFFRALRSDGRVALMPASLEFTQRGVDLYLARIDKAWSLTDCISFVVMQERGLTEALTADRHFEQAGFKALLRDAS